MARRSFVRSGMVGLSALSLADLLRLEATASERHGAAKPSGNQKSLLVLWLWGGASHMETFDLKPLAPSEFRGEFQPIRTNVPGIEISEHLPRLAGLADKFALVRSLHHDSPGHVNSTHTLLTGYPGELVETPPYAPKVPDVWSVAHRMLGERVAGVPPHVVVPQMRYQGAAYLGTAYSPYTVGGDPNSPDFAVPNLGLSTEVQQRLSARIDLRQRFDRLRRQVDHDETMESLDRFEQQALAMLTSDRFAKAFDLESEPDETRDRYGRNVVGQRCLLARRLVEAGARVVSVDFPHVPGQKAFSWDDHASVWNIFEEMKTRLPVLDQVTSALIDDLYARGLADDTLLVVMGEMSHTPRLSNFKGQPGREHWGQTMSVLMAGGGMRTGQVVGATNRRGDEIIERPLEAGDLLATWYRHLGIPLDTHFADFRGRPTPLLPSGRPIDELLPG